MSIYNREYILELFGHKHKRFLFLAVKPKMNMVQIIKAHSYPGYINMINGLRDLDEVKEIRTDLSLANYDKLAERMKKVEKFGKCDDTKHYYNGIKNLMDQGITSKDCELTDKWFKTVAREALNKRAKELRELNKKK